MLKILKRNRIKMVTGVESPSINVPDIRRIEVKDLKQYLIEEMDRTKNMQNVLDHREDDIKRLQIEEEKYKATLILMDGYSNRGSVISLTIIYFINRECNINRVSSKY